MPDGVGMLDLASWVAKAPVDKKNFREAVHIILMAIGASTVLRGSMILKGGMLMALRYDSSRYGVSLSPLEIVVLVKFFCPLDKGVKESGIVHRKSGNDQP